MPPKTPNKTPTKSTSKLQNSWNQCNLCNLILVKSNNEQHECYKLSEDQTFLYKNELANPLIFEHQIDVEKELEINKEFLFDFVFINPITMKLCNFKIGNYFVIEDSQGAFISVKCWPLLSLQIDRISLSKQIIFENNLNVEMPSSIRRIFSINKENMFHISQITLNLINLNKHFKLTDLVLNKLLIIYLKGIYLNKFITKSQIISVIYMGQKLIFEIENMITNEKQIKEPKSQNDTLNEKFQKLDLNTSINFNESNLKPIDSSSFNKNICLYLIDQKTNFKIVNMIGKTDAGYDDNAKNAENLIMFKDIGGLKNEIQLLKDLFIKPFQLTKLYKDKGISLSKGVLLYGSSGCGKTLLAKAVLNESKCNFIQINCVDILCRNYGESESKLKELFSQAWNSAPCIIFIDELDTMCGKREGMNQELEKRIVSLFSNLIDESMFKNILFLATTNKIDSIDFALRRHGRFGKEIEIPIPNQKDRNEILKIYLKSVKNGLKEDEIEIISQNCHGYVGADLKMLFDEAGSMFINRITSQDYFNENESNINKGDFFNALQKVKPSAMREISFDIPDVSWNDIGGQDDLKKKLEQAITWPITRSESYKKLGIKAPRGLLMYGPPGCSKTMIAKALATQTGLNFFAVKGPELFSKWVGESERTVREIFRKAKNAAPAIIFFDEIDAVAVERSNSASKSNSVGDRVLAQLLNEMDGLESLTNVTIVAATNRPDMIDKALIRPGRLDRLVYVKLPDKKTREEIFKLKKTKMPFLDEVNIDELVHLTNKYSGAEITALCNEAALLALDDESTAISQKNFMDALQFVLPRISQETIDYFDNFHSLTELPKIYQN